MTTSGTGKAAESGTPQKDLQKTPAETSATDDSKAKPPVTPKVETQPHTGTQTDSSTTKKTSDSPSTQPLRKRRSALSLNSLSQKPVEDETEQTDKIKKDLPRDEFSQADFFVYWKKYIDILNKQKSSMLASILNSTPPEFTDATSVKFTYPNSMMAQEVKKNEVAILNYLREKLNNYDLTFSIHYNEDQERAFIYTPQEKFEKLAQLNPNLIEFRKRFNLDF